RRHTRSTRDWSSDVCSSDLGAAGRAARSPAFTGVPEFLVRPTLGPVGRNRVVVLVVDRVLGGEQLPEVEQLERILPKQGEHLARDRKSTRLNSSHERTSYAV